MLCDYGSVIFGLEDKIVKIWDFKIRNCVIFKGYGGLVKCLVIFYDGCWIVLGLKD